MVLSATAGVEVQTEVIWDDFPDIPKMAFINRMDRENADFYKVIDDMKNKLSGQIVPVQLPIGSADTFKGVVDLISMKALIFEAGSGKVTVQEIPADMTDDVALYKEALVEAAAEADDDLINKYLEGEELTDDEVRAGIQKAAASGSAVFVFCGCATNNMAVKPLLDFVVDCAAAPDTNIMIKGKNIETEPMAAQVFKTIADPYIAFDYVPSLYRTNEERHPCV